MKVHARPTTSTPRTKAPVSSTSSKAPAKTQRAGWAASSSGPRAAVTKLATSAVLQALRAPAPETPSKHPALERFGRRLGLGLGVIVTEALALVPSWNKRLVDGQGKPLASIHGAERVGDHDLRKRHEEFVGPKVAALVEKMRPSALRDVLDGFARGATAAPGASYRLEVAVEDVVKHRTR